MKFYTPLRVLVELTMLLNCLCRTMVLCHKSHQLSSVIFRSSGCFCQAHKNVLNEVCYISHTNYNLNSTFFFWKASFKLFISSREIISSSQTVSFLASGFFVLSGSKFFITIPSFNCLCITVMEWIVNK